MNKSFLTCFLLLTSLFSYSQSDSTLTDDSLNNFSERIQTIISHQDIENSHSKTLARLLNEQAGIVVNGAYQPMGSFINIYMDGYVGGKALIEIDGLPVLDPASIADNYFDLNFIPLSIIERIIITHGCHSTEHGSGAVAGVINIITIKREILNKINLIGEMGLGNRNTHYKNIQLYGSLKKFNYQINYSGYETKGFSDAHDTTGKLNFDNDGFNRRVINTNLEYQANKNLKVYSYLLYSKYKADTDADDFTDAKNYYYKNSFLNGGIGFNYLKNSLSITGNYKYSDVTRAYYDVDINSEKMNGFAQLISFAVKKSFNKKLSLSGGIEYRHNKFKDFFTDVTFGTIENRYPNTLQYGAYSMLRYFGMGGRFTASVGCRINNYNEEKSDYCYYISNSYKVSEAIKITANINTGYTTPTIYTAKDSLIGNKSLVSEQAINYQIGLVYKRNRWENKLMVFKNNLTNGIDYAGNINIYSNCNSFNLWGIEYEGLLPIKRHLFIQLNYSFITGNETTISRQSFLDTTQYNYLLRVPESNINLKIKYETKNRNHLSLGLKYVNNYYDVSIASDDTKMNGYFLLNMNCTINITKDVSLNCEVQNLLNNRFHDTRGYNSIPILINSSIQFKL